MKHRSLAHFVGAAAIVVFTAGAGAADKGSIVNASSNNSSFSPADSLDQAVDHWYEAVLAGDSNRSHDCEHCVILFLTADVNRTQEQASRLIKQMDAEPKDSLIGPSAVADLTPNPLRDSLDFLMSELHVKRILMSSVSKSNAFSNKYRLLGDYVELLRRELGLPKLKLASEKRAESQKD